MPDMKPCGWPLQHGFGSVQPELEADCFPFPIRTRIFWRGRIFGLAPNMDFNQQYLSSSHDQAINPSLPFPNRLSAELIKGVEWRSFCRNIPIPAQIFTLDDVAIDFLPKQPAASSHLALPPHQIRFFDGCLLHPALLVHFLLSVKF